MIVPTQFHSIVVIILSTTVYDIMPYKLVTWWCAVSSGVACEQSRVDRVDMTFGGIQWHWQSVSSADENKSAQRIMQPTR